jgi:hypothetical protein
VGGCEPACVLEAPRFLKRTVRLLISKTEKQQVIEMPSPPPPAPPHKGEGGEENAAKPSSPRMPAPAKARPARPGQTAGQAEASTLSSISVTRMRPRSPAASQTPDGCGTRLPSRILWRRLRLTEGALVKEKPPFPRLLKPSITGIAGKTAIKHPAADLLQRGEQNRDGLRDACR